MSSLDENLKLFKENAEKTTASVQFVRNQAELVSAISQQIGSQKKVLTSLKDKSILTTINDRFEFIVNPNKDELTFIPVCITDCEYGISETGSVIISNDLGYTAYLTMLTSKHIIIVNSYQILQKPRDIFFVQNPALRNHRSFSIITGPSATADMGSLVRGVHGPEKVHIIVLVEDAN